MDQRRFLTWLMLTAAMFFLYTSMLKNPQQPPQPLQNAPAAGELNADPLLQENAGEVKAEIEGAELAAAQNPALSDPAVTANPEQIVTLGSMDPAKDFNLLVAISSRGAGVLRAELVEQKKSGRLKFRALEHEGGYLGYLAWQPDPKGVRIRLVPPGSPAALAKSSSAESGLQIDDILTEINNHSVDSPTTAQLVLQKTKPGKSVELGILRSVDGSERSLKFTTNLVEAPMDVLRTDEFLSEIVPGNYETSSLLTTLASINGTRIPAGQKVIPALSGTLKANWDVHPLEVAGGEGVEFRLPLDSFLEKSGRPKQIDLVKRYRLLPRSTEKGQAAQDGYILDLETVVVNRNDQPVDIALRQLGVAGLTLEGWWYSVKISPHMFSGAGQRDVIYNTTGTGHDIRSTRGIVDYAKKTPAMPAQLIFSEGEAPEVRTLKYIGLDAQYFNSSILPHPESPDSLKNLRQAASTAEANMSVLNKSQLQGANVSFWFDTNDQSIAPGAELSQRYQVFIGPKDTDTLAAHGLDRAIEYGWFPWIAKPLSAILHFFYAIVRNYGIAIIMLTVMVRGAMFPLGRKAAMNAQRMQELQPELKKINDQYKDNMEKRAKAMQELYQKHNFKPLAGCLPMFIQLPIFIGLYRCLSVDISLRQEPLLPGLEWCSNLAGPDMLFNWSSWMPEFIAGRGAGWLGPYFNILPMVTVALFLVQQKILMPKATDEQTQMTQNMMQIMTVFMGVLFFKVPAGLCIYFITSSIWSLVERKLVKRLTPAKPVVENVISTSNKTQTNKSDAPAINRRDRNRQNDSASPEKPAKKTRFEELRAMLDKPAVKSATQRDSRKERKRKK